MGACGVLGPGSCMRMCLMTCEEDLGLGIRLSWGCGLYCRQTGSEVR